MNDLKSQLKERKKLGHDSLMQILLEQKKELEENMHIMKVIAIHETLCQLIDNKSVKELNATYIKLVFDTYEDQTNLRMSMAFKDQDRKTIVPGPNGNMEVYKKVFYLVSPGLEKNKLDPSLFDREHNTDMEISKNGIDRFTKTLLTGRLRELFEASMQAMALEDAITKPSFSKKKRSHKV